MISDEPALEEQAAASRAGLERFLGGEGMKYEFAIPCPPARRIDYIYSIVLPGWK